MRAVFRPVELARQAFKVVLSITVLVCGRAPCDLTPFFFFLPRLRYIYRAINETVVVSARCRVVRRYIRSPIVGSWAFILGQMRLD